MERDSTSTIRREAAAPRSATKISLGLMCLLTGSMLAMAIPNLVSGDVWSVVIKSLLLGIGGVVVSYAVNRLAVERGAPLAAIGYNSAVVVSVLSILIIGIGLFSATFAGLTYKDVEQLSLDAHGEALGQFAAERAALAADAGQVVPTINSVVADLAAKQACELASSCVSGNGPGGNGPVNRALLGLLSTAQSIADQIGTGSLTQAAALDEVNTLIGQYGLISGSNELGMDDKRTALSGIDRQVKQAIARLDQSMPVSLVSSYGSGLAGGIGIADRPEASRMISELLAQHSEALTARAASLSAATIPAPSFPRAVGVTDTFAYIGHFLPIAAVAGVVELVFPLCLWLYTFFALSRDMERRSPRPPRGPDPDAVEFQRLLFGPIETHARPDDALGYQPPARRARRLNSRSSVTSSFSRH